MPVPHIQVACDQTSSCHSAPEELQFTKASAKKSHLQTNNRAPEDAAVAGASSALPEEVEQGPQNVLGECAHGLPAVHTLETIFVIRHTPKSTCPPAQSSSLSSIHLQEVGAFAGSTAAGKIGSFDMSARFAHEDGSEVQQQFGHSESAETFLVETMHDNEAFAVNLKNTSQEGQNVMCDVSEVCAAASRTSMTPFITTAAKWLLRGLVIGSFIILQDNAFCK